MNKIITFILALTIALASGTEAFAAKKKKGKKKNKAHSSKVYKAKKRHFKKK